MSLRVPWKYRDLTLGYLLSWALYPCTMAHRGVPINENDKDPRIANCQQSTKSYIVCNHGSMLTLGKVQAWYSNRKQNSQLTCQHAHHRKQDLLYTLHRAPPLSTALIAHGIIAWGMQDGDADSPVRIDCKSQRQPLCWGGFADRGPAICTAVTGHFLVAQIPERPTNSRPDLLGIDKRA